MLKQITPKMTRITSVAIVTFFAMCLTALAAHTASAASFVVTNTNDSGQGSLRQAILDANDLAGADTIEFNLGSCPCVITLTTGSLVIIPISGDLTINGPGANLLTVDGNGADGVIRIPAPGNVTIGAVTVTGGTGIGIGKFDGGLLSLVGVVVTHNAGTGLLLNSSAGSLSVTDSTISNNSSSTDGGGIFSSGTLSVTNSTISRNSAHNGGGIANLHLSTITKSTISGNSARAGGGIWNTDQLSIIGSTISDNGTRNGGSIISCVQIIDDDEPPPPPVNPDAGHGGGIYNAASLVVHSSLFTGNRTGRGGSTGCGNAGNGGSGGAIRNDGSATLDIRNSTFSGNSTGDGGESVSYQWNGGHGGNGAAIHNVGSMSITNATISAHNVGQPGQGLEPGLGGSGSVFNASNTAGSFELISSIVANTNAGVDVQGLVSAGEHNLVETPSGILPGSDNLVGVDPMLGPLQFHGGPTKTYALLPGSPAIDAGSNPLALSTDQRGTGFARVVGVAADIGAFEVQPSCAGITFAPATNSPTGEGTRSVAVGDFDGDGNLDLASANLNSQNVSVLLGDGAGGFAAAVNFAAGGGPVSVATGDFDGDGRLDLVSANSYSDNISVLLGDGAGGFAAPVNFATGSYPTSVTTGDFNRDGRLDLAAANLLSSNISVLLGDGSGGFAATVNFAAGSGPYSVATGDFDGDGNLDLASANLNSQNVSVLLGDGAGGFAAAVNFAAGSYPTSVTTGDFDADGNLDLAAADVISDIVSVLLGDGAGGFEAATGFGVTGGPYSVAAGDFDGDGRLDLATANNSSANVTVLLGDGSGGFAVTVNFAAGSGPYSVATGDFDGDGRLDLVAGNYGNVSVLLNNCSANSPPVAANDSRSTNEDTSLSGSSVLANDTDGENDTLTAILVSGPTNAQSFTLNANGSFSYTPNANFNGSDSFTYTANDGSLDSNVATVTLAVDPVNDAPLIAATPKTQSAVQYSDPIAPVAINVSDVETSAADLTIGFSYRKDGGSAVAGLPGGMVRSGSPGAWTVSGLAFVPQGIYVITATVTDTGDGSSAARSSSDTFTITVSLENATVTPSTSNPATVKVNTPGGTAGPITLCADIGEMPDGNGGNLVNAVPVTFILAPVAGGSALQQVDATLIGPTACVTFPSVPVNVYDITITVGGNYYTGSGSSVLAVFDPTLGFTTGGGRVFNPTTGNILHFGFSFKYDKKGFKGQMLVMEHTATGDVKLKSNSLTSLSIVGKQAIVLGKASIADGSGNLSFRLNVTDNGEPGSSDLFGLKTTTAAGASIPAFYFDPPRLILGGNIQVPQGR